MKRFLLLLTIGLAAGYSLRLSIFGNQASVPKEAIPKISTPFDVIPYLPGGAGAYFHGPSTIVASNGDVLVATAMGRTHGIGVIVQARSKDGGETWANSDRGAYEGVVYDHALTNKGGSAYNPAYALAPNGNVILVVQTTAVDRLKEEGEAAGFGGYIYLLSSDHGMQYRYKGYVDSSNPKRVGAVTTNILTRKSTLYLLSASYGYGCLLYVSQDNGETWQMRSAVFPPDNISAPLWYPTFTFLPDGSIYVLALARMPDNSEANYTRVSSDDGKTWGPIRLADGISVRHPVLNWVGKTLVVHGRHTPTQDVVIHYSFDEGRTWHPRQIIEDYDSDGGYSSSVQVGDKLFVAFSSDARKQPLPRTDPSSPSMRICRIRGLFIRP